MKKIFYLVTLFLAASLGSYISINAQNKATDTLHLIKETIIGGEGSWDFLNVDSKNRMLFISHSTQVEVLNVDTHSKIGVIKDTKGAHGIISVPALNKGYITNGKSNTVTVFNLKTLQVITDIPTGKKPDALLYDEFSKKIFVFNNGDGSVTVIDPKINTVIKTIEIGGALEIGVTNGKGIIYVNVEDKSEIVVFDSKDYSIKNRFKLSPGEEPTGLDIDIKNNRLFSGCHNGLLIILDALTGKVIDKQAIGKGVDGVAFIEKNNLIISSNGEGSLTIIKQNPPNDYKLHQTVQTFKGAKTIAFDIKTNHIFTTTAQYGETPAATTDNPKPRAPIIKDTFKVIEYGIK